MIDLDHLCGSASAVLLAKSLEAQVSAANS